MEPTTRPLTPREVEATFGISTSRLANMRWLGTGPKFTKARAGWITYRAADILDWLATRVDGRRSR